VACGSYCVSSIHTGIGACIQDYYVSLKRRMFGPKKEGVVGRWRRLHNLYASPDSTRVIKSRRVGCVGHAECMGVMKNAHNFFFLWKA
jgi:hypothetical protein